MLVAGQKSGYVFALDPAQKGKILWQKRVGKGGVNGGVQWGMASDGQKALCRDGRLAESSPAARARRPCSAMRITIPQQAAA